MTANMPPEDGEMEEFNAESVQQNEIELENGDNDEVGEADDDIDIESSDGDEEDADIDLIDDSKLAFQKHEASVFCLDISKNDSPLIVTGGEDDKGYVWNYEADEILFECTGHKDSVTSCGFSSDSKYVMTADMGGTVIVFNTADGKKVWDYDCSDLEWCKWHGSAHVLFAGTSSGDVYMWKIPSGDCKIYASHGTRTICGAVMPNGKEIAVGYEDGSLKKWDLKSVSCTYHYKSDQEDAILSLDILSVGQKNGNLVVCGTQSGTVKIFNSHTWKQIGNFTVSANNEEEDTHMEEDGEEYIPVNSIESVSFSPCGSYIVCGSLNGNMCIWDIASQRIRHELTNPTGVSKLLWHVMEPNYIITACLDGIVRMWDHKTGELFQEYYGHLGNILDVSLSGDGKYILTAGDDSTVRVFVK